MSEQPPEYKPESGPYEDGDASDSRNQEQTHPPLDDILKDPVLLDLLVKAHDAFDELAKYMVLKAAEAGIDLPPEWTELGLKLPPLEEIDKDGSR